MPSLKLWSAVIARLTRGALPVDGYLLPAGNEVREDQSASPVRPPEPLTSETEFDGAIYPRWGNFR